MFYYRIAKTTRAVPKLKQNSAHQAASYRNAAEHVFGLIAGGEYSRVTYESINQAAYVRATRGGE